MCAAWKAIVAAALAGCTAAPPTPDEQHAATLAEWRDMRFGMFIHWGPVALRGTEIGWSRGTQVPRAEYDALGTRFDAPAFDPREWARVAKAAGMKYVVLTSKHHDGFCLWDSAVTEHDVMSSPLRRDVVGELAAACRKEGLAFGLYYSILDWYQPDYNTAGSQGGPGCALSPGEAPSMDRYEAYLHTQLRELAERYGPLLTFWFDGHWEEPWTIERGERLAAFCRDLDPRILVNNRVGRARPDASPPGDYGTPEQEIGAFDDERPWETCMTICRQWAWKPDDALKSREECIRTLVKTAGGDGNLLLNVGLMPDGRIEPRQADRLREVGEWLAGNGESIYGTRGGPFYPGEWGASTHRGRLVYVHVFAWEEGERALPGLDQRIVAAHRLGGGAVDFAQTDSLVTLRVPPAAQDPVNTIIVLELAAPVRGHARGSRVPTAFDRGEHGEWLSAHATYELSSRAPQWSRHEDRLLGGEDYPADFAFHTAEERDPWIAIDLGEPCAVRGLEIENRRNGFQERATGLTAWVSTDGETWRPVWQAAEIRAKWEIVLDPPAAGARYVRIGRHAERDGYLHLYSVRVYGDR
ncbi:MAG: alpha-L-fucosidase [Planctomycetota bacterium]